MFEVGDRVLIIDGFGDPRFVGLRGTVVVVSTRELGVTVENCPRDAAYSAGHNLGGKIKTNNGRWFYPRHLEMDTPANPKAITGNLEYLSQLNELEENNV